MEKVCTNCKSQKDLLLFPARKTSKDGRASWCRECYKKGWEIRYRDKHQHYRDSHNHSRNKLRELYARKVFEYLSQHQCLICGESDPVVLEFHHRSGADKIESISNLIFNASWKRIENEIQKCDVLCANCHRRKTAAQFNYKRYIFYNS